MSAKKNNKPLRIIVGCFFVVLILIGLVLYRDFGLSWDEGAQRGNGIEVARYVLNGDPTLLTDQDRYNVGFFQVVLIAIEYALNLTDDTQSIFFMRHLATYLAFLVGLYFFYRLSSIIFGSWKSALLACVFLILSPRIFAHSFYNSQDILLLVMYIISVFTLIRYLKKPSLNRMILHAVISALTMNTRFLGVMIPFITCVLLIPMIIEPHKKRIEFVISACVYMVVTTSLFVLLCPPLWDNPPLRFLEALQYMRDVPWGGRLLYMGEILTEQNLPWHYSVVWILISTPMFYTFLFLIGFVTMMVSLIRRKGEALKMRQEAIVVLWFFLPLIGVIALRPGLYDAWRHLFFIYPAFVIMAIAGWRFFWCMSKRIFDGAYYRPIKALIVIVTLGALMTTVHTMTKLHPFQNVYFNRLAGKDMKAIKQEFELDYWGLSYRRALEHVLANDHRATLKIYVANQPGKENAKILTRRERERIEFIDSLEHADYFLSNYRWHKEDYPYGEPYYFIEIGGAKIMVVYKRPFLEV